jgi:hypothetical protein
MDQVSDSSVIANTELKKVDLHNNVKYTILQMEYRLIICRRVVTVFRFSFFFILAYCRSKRIIVNVIVLYISHCTQTENAHILSTVKLLKFWNKCCESTNQLWQNQASVLWGLGVEIKRCRKNVGFILNLSVINETKPCSLVLRMKGYIQKGGKMDKDVLSIPCILYTLCAKCLTSLIM